MITPSFISDPRLSAFIRVWFCLFCLLIQAFIYAALGEKDQAFAWLDKAYEGRDIIRSYLGDYFPLEDVRKCREQLESNANLKLYTTPIAMDDLDDARAALGYNQINIIGGSYGTRAAQVYLKLHQTRVRAVILHGVSPTNQSMPRDFPQHTERALNGVIADCAADDACRVAFPNLRAEAKSVLEKLLRGPVEVDLKRQPAGESIRISLSRDLVAEAVRYMLYQPAAASRIPLFLHLAAQGNFTPLAEASISYRQQIVATGSNGMYLTRLSLEAA